MKEVEFRKICARCGAVINRDIHEIAEDYTGKRIIVTKDLCRHCRNGKVFTERPYFVGPVRIG